MSKIGDFGRSFVSDLSGLADAAKEKAETLKSKAGHQFDNLAALANRKSSPSPGSPPRKSFGAQFTQKMTDIKHSASELKQDMKAFGSYILKGEGKSSVAPETAQAPQTASNTSSAAPKQPRPESAQRPEQEAQAQQAPQSAPQRQPRRGAAERLRRESQTPRHMESDIPQRQPRRGAAERPSRESQTPLHMENDIPLRQPRRGRAAEPRPQNNGPSGSPPQGGGFHSHNGVPPQGGSQRPPEFAPPPPPQDHPAPERPAPSGPASPPQRQAALQALGLPDTLGEAYVADKMKTPQGRRQLMGEVIRATQSYAKAFQKANKGVDPNSEKGKALDQACEQLLDGLNQTKASLEVIAHAEIPEDKRSEALKHVGVDSPMSMAYLEANATTPEGVGQMKAELQKFDRTLKIAYRKGALAKHPDKAAVGMKEDSPQYQKVASDFKAFESSSKALLGMVEGLQARLEQMEARGA